MPLFFVSKYLTSQELKLLKYGRKASEVRHTFSLCSWSENKNHNRKLKTLYVVKTLHLDRQ